LIELVRPPRSVVHHFVRANTAARLRPTCVTFALRARCHGGGVAQLRSVRSMMMRGKWWKYYFYFAVVITVYAISAPFWSDDKLRNAWWWAYIPLYALQAVSLFGFVYMRPIGGATLWKTLFILTIVYEIWSAYDMTTSVEPLASPVAAAVVLTLVYFVQLPLWYGNFLYGFRCKDLWNAKT